MKSAHNPCVFQLLNPPHPLSRTRASGPLSAGRALKLPDSRSLMEAAAGSPSDSWSCCDFMRVCECELVFHCKFESQNFFPFIFSGCAQMHFFKNSFIFVYVRVWCQSICFKVFLFFCSILYVIRLDLSPETRCCWIEKRQLSFCSNCALNAVCRGPANKPDLQMRQRSARS